MLEFTKREYANEYSVWCMEEDDLVVNSGMIRKGVAFRIF